MDEKRNFFCLEVQEKKKKKRPPAVEIARKASARASKLVETRQQPITADAGRGSAALAAESPHWRHPRSAGGREKLLEHTMYSVLCRVYQGAPVRCPG